MPTLKEQGATIYFEMEEIILIRFDTYLMMILSVLFVYVLKRGDVFIVVGFAPLLF